MRKSASAAALKSATCADGELPAWKLARRRTRVARIDACVDEPVERHREERAPTIATVIHTRSCADGVPPTARNAPTYANGSAKTVCSILTRRAKRAGRGGASVRKPSYPFRSVALFVCDGTVPPRSSRACGERRAQDFVAVAAAAGRTGEVDDQRRVDDAGDAAREQRVRRLMQALDAECLRRCPAPRAPARRGRLRRHVAGREPRAPRREDDLRACARARAAPRRSRRARPARRVAPPRSHPRAAARSSRSPLPSSASPRETRSETVSTATFTPAPSSSRAAARRRSSSPCRRPCTCRRS